MFIYVLQRMRSSRVVRASDCQCNNCNGPGFDPSIRRHSGIRVAADEAVLNTVGKKHPPENIKNMCCRVPGGNQWWMKLRSIMGILAQHDSTYEVG